MFWIVLSYFYREVALLMIQQGRTLGMSMAEPYKYLVLSQMSNQRINTGDQLRRALTPVFEGLKRDGVQLVMVVVGDRPHDSYSKDFI